MSKKFLVEVVYGGEIEKAFLAEKGFDGPTGVMTDFRFQPFITSNEERSTAERVAVKVDKWRMSYLFRSKIDRYQIPECRWQSAVDVNTFLSVLSHFGFDADYNPDFVRRVEPLIADVMLQAYRVDPEARISAREFHDVTYIRGEFFHKFDDFLVKYGM